MKKVVAGLLLACALLSLAGCAKTQPESEASLPTLAEVDPRVQESSAPPALELPAEQEQDAPDELDTAAFKAFVEEGGMGIFAGYDIPAEGSLDDIIHPWNAYGWVSWSLDYAFEAGGFSQVADPETDLNGFTKEELVQAANELFGGRLDFEKVLAADDTRAFYDYAVAGKYNKTWGFGPAYGGTPAWDTLAYENGVAAVTVDYTSQSGSSWTTRFYYAPRPSNQWIPFELLWAEELERMDMVEPNVLFDMAVPYRTTAALNLRRGPGTEYEPPLYTLDAGTQVYVGGKLEGNDEWVYVHEGMAGGWLNLEYLEPVE